MISYIQGVRVRAEPEERNLSILIADGGEKGGW
jgi:hypothetical protein